MKYLLSFLLLVASISSVFGSGLAGSAQDSVREPKSKVEFPLVLKSETLAKGLPADSAGFPTRLPAMTLTGTGLRTKTWFNVKVYAMGLYVDDLLVSTKLADWRGKSAKQLQGDGKFYGALLEERFGKTLRLVMCRDVDGDDMAEAFDDSLGPRLTRAITKDEKRGSKQDLATFRKYFDLDEVKEDVELLFTWMPGGKLYTRVDGKFVGVIDSPALCWALFDIYLGGDPITEKGKKSLIERFPALLSASPKK